MKLIGTKLRVLAALLATLCVLIGLAVFFPFVSLNALTWGDGAHAVQDIAYGPGERNKLDVYTPVKLHCAAPVVVFFYGGNWVRGRRDNYAFVGRALASRGIVAVVADYRLYPEVKYPDFLHDAAQAVAWTVRHAGRYGGDPKRVFVMGHSAGAYNAAMVALDARWLGREGVSPAQLRGWIGLAGPYDFIPIKNLTARPVFHFPNTPVESQPIVHVSRRAPPALLIAPEEDSLVNPRRNTGGLARSLREQGIPVTERYYGRVNHASLMASFATPARWLAPTLDLVEQFVAGSGENVHAQLAAR